MHMLTLLGATAEKHGGEGICVEEFSPEKLRS